MPISVRLKPELERLLAAASRRERKSRSAIIHDALAARLKPKQRNLGDAIAEALRVAPGGFGIERDQPALPDKRDWAA